MEEKRRLIIKEDNHFHLRRKNKICWIILLGRWSMRLLMKDSNGIILMISWKKVRLVSLMKKKHKKINNNIKHKLLTL